jgi:hypothetical protein
MKKNFIQGSKIVVLGMLLSVGLSYVIASTSTWSNPPSGTPPYTNVAAPISEGSADQNKTGGLAIGTKPSGYSSFPRTNYMLDIAGKAFANHLFADDMGLGTPPSGQSTFPLTGTMLEADGVVSTTGLAVFGGAHSTSGITDDKLATGGADQPVCKDSTGKLKLCAAATKSQTYYYDSNGILATKGDLGTSVSTSTFIVPNGATSLTVTVTGGGAGGGAGAKSLWYYNTLGSAFTTGYAFGGGGGAGGNSTSISKTSTVAAGDSFSITVGKGGTGTSALTSVTNNGTSNTYTYSIGASGTPSLVKDGSSNIVAASYSGCGGTSAVSAAYHNITNPYYNWSGLTGSSNTNATDFGGEGGRAGKTYTSGAALTCLASTQGFWSNITYGTSSIGPDGQWGFGTEELKYYNTSGYGAQNSGYDVQINGVGGSQGCTAAGCGGDGGSATAPVKSGSASVTTSAVKGSDGQPGQVVFEWK